MSGFNSPEAQERRRQKNLLQKIEKSQDLIISFKKDYPNLAHYSDIKILNIIDELDYENNKV